MTQLCDQNHCTGCSACASACPKGCIVMEADGEGFLYPKVDESNCINCGKCEKACPVLSFQIPERNAFPLAYSACNRDDAVLARSSSGGVFSALAEQTIRSGGIVYGAAFCEDFSVAHMRAETLDEIAAFRGSKYVQSDCSNVFASAKKDLEDGLHVLFSGSPCQVAGLRQFLSKDYEKLLLVDTTCHSVPSPKAWKKFLSEIGNCHNSRICGVNFRDKRNGWEQYQLCIKTEDGGEVLYPRSQNLYMEAFLRSLISRKSCAHCTFKGQNRASDLTLSDFWGVQTVFPEAYRKAGTSLVLVQSEKGQGAFSSICDQLDVKPVDIAAALQGNPAYYVSMSPHTRRSECFEKMEQVPFDVLVEQCLAPTPKEIVCMKLQKSFLFRALRKAKRLLLDVI